MAPAPLDAIIQRLRATGFRELAGLAVSLAVPVPEHLINEFLAATLPRDAPVREVRIHPEAGHRFAVSVSPRAALLPQMTIRLMIERQPEFPGSPILALRMITLPGVFSFAGAALSLDRLLPPGVRVHGELILVDLAALAARSGLSDLVPLIRRLRLQTEAGVLLIQGEAGVPPTQN